jgi:ribosomal protein L11 methyltransferase
MLRKIVMIPYQDLYIYEVSGELLGSRNYFKEDFVGCWNEGDVSFLFFSAPHDKEVNAFLRKKRKLLLSTHVLDYQSWQAGEELKPFNIGSLVVSPPWEEGVVGPGEKLIRLDPCVVFGTGYHATTRSCLRALVEIYEKERPKRVLDLGTGSGILALAAAKLGAEEVLAVDLNELAVETALRNVLLNDESARIEVKRGKAEDFVEEEADLLCANLHFQVIVTLLERQAFFKKRWLILSGLLERDRQEIEHRLLGGGLEIYLSVREKHWTTLVVLNRNESGD